MELVVYSEVTNVKNVVVENVIWLGGLYTNHGENSSTIKMSDTPAVWRPCPWFYSPIRVSPSQVQPEDEVMKDGNLEHRYLQNEILNNEMKPEF